MQYIQDKSGKTILAFDGDDLYFRSQEPDENSELDESISIEQLRVENNGGLKFYTILGLQKELNIICGENEYWDQILLPPPNLPPPILPNHYHGHCI
jgi:hypothetical protein